MFPARKKIFSVKFKLAASITTNPVINALP